MLGCAAALGASLLGWLIYASSGQSLEQYLQTVRFDEANARAIAAFSIGQVGWFVLFLMLASGAMVLHPERRLCRGAGRMGRRVARGAAGGGPWTC